jgi:hypothetical protein
VTPDEAREIAANLYDDHPAAAALMIEAVGGSTPDRRERSRRALMLLDPMEELPDLRDQHPSWRAALAIATLLVQSVSTTRKARAHVADLLGKVCMEAKLAAADSGERWA